MRFKMRKNVPKSEQHLKLASLKKTANIPKRISRITPLRNGFTLVQQEKLPIFS